MRDENPLLYRFQQAQKRRTKLSRLSSWALYPLLLMAPALMQMRSNAHREQALALMLTIFLSFAYLCVRTLFDAVGTLARERQRGTLESLATTGFPPRLWVGTLFRLCIQPRLAEVAAWGWLPFVLLAYKLNEDAMFAERLEPISSHYLPFLLYSASCIVFYASAGLWLSARARSLAWAQLQAIGLLSVTFFGALALDIFLTDMTHHNGPLLSPLVSPWMVCLWEMIGDKNGGLSQKWDWVLASLVQASMTVLFLRLCIARMGAAERGATRKSGPGRTGRAPFRWVSNPLIYRSLQQLSQQRLLLLRFLSYPALFFALRGAAALFSIGKESYDALRFTESCLLLTLFGHVLYLTVRAAFAGSLAVAEEREGGSWESLLSTRLSLNELLWGQWASAVLPTVGEGFLWSFLWLTYYGTGRNSQVVTLAATFVPLISYSLIWTAFIGTYALWRSGRSASAAQALRHTTTVVLILSLGPVILSALCGRVETLGWLSPAYGLGELACCGTIPWACMALYGLATPVLLLLSRRNLRA